MCVFRCEGARQKHSKSHERRVVKIETLGTILLQQWFNWQTAQRTITTYIDADWAGCKNTRKPTTGGVVTIGNHDVKSWSKTQALIALSSGESELYAALKASAETLGVISMLADFGLTMAGEIWGDAQATSGIINRSGLGKTRHIQTGLLWIQQVSAQKRLAFGKVLGKENLADLFTKYLDSNTIGQHLQRLNSKFIEGRANEALKLHNISISLDEYNLMGTRRQWEWLGVIADAVRHKSSKVQGYKQRRSYGGDLNIVTGHRQATSSRQQVLWGYTRQVQGCNGSNAAQPGRPQGSALTFQHNVGVSCGTGLRHGVTMHQRGRQLREGMILLPHGTHKRTEREQQQQLQDSCEDKYEKLKGTVDDKRKEMKEQWLRSKDQVSIKTQTFEKIAKRESSILRKNYCNRATTGNSYHRFSPARRQSGELYCVKNHTRRNIVDTEQKLTGSLRGTEQLGVAMRRKENIVSTNRKQKTNNTTTTNWGLDRQHDTIAQVRRSTTAQLRLGRCTM